MRQNDKKFGTQALADENLKAMLTDNEKFGHPTLNFVMPHELGGCGAPLYENDVYRLFNTFGPDDQPEVRPRWTTKDEFKVELPRNPALDEDE